MPDSPQTTATPEAAQTDSQPRQSPSVLVVDDSRDTLRIACRFFERAGISAHQASSGEEALAYLENHTPELICSDINMPGIGGLELCRAVRKRKATRDVPIIIFTALSSSAPIGEAFAAGASDYVAKPLRDIELVSRARHHIADYREFQRNQQRIQNLNHLNETKNKFLGVASHDLRNPLVSIRGISQYLHSQRFGPLNEGQMEMISTIADASAFMLTLVEDLLDISKIESDQIDLKLEPIAISELLLHAHRLHQNAAARKQIELVLDDRTEQATAPLDRKLMTRVLDNLISNAIKFSFPGTRATLVATADPENVIIRVEDEGPGIPPDEFDRLFKEFSRTSSQPTGGESSSGIGLYVVRRIAQQHNASITAENRAEGGARFTLTLPRKQQ